MTHEPAVLLAARLLAHRAIPRNDPLVRRLLSDDAFRADVETRLAAVGLILLENPYATHVAVGLRQEAEDAVFGGQAAWQSNNLGLPRDGIALLVVLWALLILPKRERQIARQSLADTSQTDLFGGEKPLPKAEEVAAGLPEVTLIAEFGERLGGKTRINFNLGVLARAGFIDRRNKVIYEGPLLDLAFDYQLMASRIIDGALAELLAPGPAGETPSRESGPEGRPGEPA